MKSVNLNCQQQSELVGRLFIEEDLLDTQQMTCLKSEISKPSYDYGVNEGTAWAFYNNVTHALKKAHPRDWLNDQQNFHDFITVELINKNLYSNLELNNDPSLIDITMEDSVDIVIDEDITDKRLIQEMYMGRL